MKKFMIRAAMFAIVITSFIFTAASIVAAVAYAVNGGNFMVAAIGGIIGASFSMAAGEVMFDSILHLAGKHKW